MKRLTVLVLLCPVAAAAQFTPTPYCFTPLPTNTPTITRTATITPTFSNTPTRTPTGAAAGGAFAWAKGISATSGNINAMAVATDSTGAAIVVGQFTGSVTIGVTQLVSAGGSDIFMTKVLTDGTYAWAKRFGNTGGDAALSVTVDASDRIIMTGYFQTSIDLGGGVITSAQSSFGSQDIFLAQYTSGGAWIWARAFGSTLADIGRGVAIDPSGNILLTGEFVGLVNFGNTCGTYPNCPTNLLSSGNGVGIDTFIAKYSNGGVFQWAKHYTTTGDDAGYAIASDAAGNVGVTGTFTTTCDFGAGVVGGTSGQPFIYVNVMNPAGTYQWAQIFGGTTIGNGTGHGIRFDSSGNAVAVGGFVGTGINMGGGFRSTVSSFVSSGFLVEYAPGGIFRWDHLFSGTGSSEAFGVAVDSSANVAVAGYFGGSQDFGDGSVNSAGGNDIFLANYGPAAGGFLWKHTYGAINSDVGAGVATDASRNRLETGIFNGTVDFGGGNVVGTSTANTFILKVGP